MHAMVWYRCRGSDPTFSLYAGPHLPGMMTTCGGPGKQEPLMTSRQHTVH
jgi:hypothetical protein